MVKLTDKQIVGLAHQPDDAAAQDADEQPGIAPDQTKEEFVDEEYEYEYFKKVFANQKTPEEQKLDWENRLAAMTPADREAAIKAQEEYSQYLIYKYDQSCCRYDPACGCWQWGRRPAPCRLRL